MTKREKELNMLYQAADEFARKILAPAGEEAERYPFGPFPEHLLSKSFDLDFFHTLLPESLGGMEMGIRGLCALLEPICRVDAGFGGIIFTTAFASDLIVQAGALEVLKPFMSPESNVKQMLIATPVFCNPSETEPRIGAQMKDGRYSLSGVAEYIVLGNIAEKCLIPATINGQTGYSYFLVDLTQNGITKSEPVLSLGMHACPAVDVTLKNVYGILIGAEQKGETYFQSAFDRFQAVATAMAVGVMKGAFKEGVAYAGKREQGGREIIHWSEVRMMLSEMALNIRISEMALVHAAKAADEGSEGWRRDVSAAAVRTGEMVCTVTTDGVQVLGGVGYMKDFGQEKRFRDARHVQNLLGAAALKKRRFLESII